MPLHPVPIIIGTTLAVISGGMAFKKFVYDPHLAPYIEAFIAAHAPTRPNVDNRQAIPVSASASHDRSGHARSSARRDRGIELRRRRVSNEYEYENDFHHDGDDQEGEPLLSLAHGDRDVVGLSSTYEPYMAEPSMRHSATRSGRASQAYPHVPARSHAVRSNPLGQYGQSRPERLQRPARQGLDRPSSPQDAEVRQVIFNQPPTPLRPTSASPSATAPAPVPMSANVFHPFGAAIPDILTSPPKAPRPIPLADSNDLSPDTAPPEQLPSEDQPNSTAFSFLSLSQVSSPEAPHAILSSMHSGFSASASGSGRGSGSGVGNLEPGMSFGDALDQWAAVPRAAERRNTLRLDQAGMEEDGTCTLDEWADIRPGSAAGAVSERESQARDRREEDVMSLPETTTSTSGYEDAESYSPGASIHSIHHPVRIHAGGPTALDAIGDGARAGESSASRALGSGLETLRDLGSGALRRSGDSVISLSESEGWTGMSDLDGSSVM